MVGSDRHEFGGAAGRVFRETFSLGTLLTGIVLGAMFFVATRMVPDDASPGITAAILHGILALALGRFALNGLAGEWSGWIFSTTGGSWLRAGSVALRYAALAALWLVPATLVSRSAAPEQVGGLLFGMSDPRALALGLLYVTATLLTPALFLIVAASAERFVEVVSPAHWRALFSGRRGDLALVYALYLGGTLGLAVLLVPGIAALFALHRELGMMIGVMALAFGGGFAVTLLGRLCGFFAFFAATEGLAEPAGAPIPPVRAGAGAHPAPLDAASKVPAGAGEAPAGRPSLGLIGGRAPATPSGKPPLLDARERVEELVRRFDQSPDAVLAGLEELRSAWAENPLVLHALCLLRRRAGDVEGALAVADDAIPLFFLRGNVRLAAEVFHALADRAGELDLRRDEMLDLAGQLQHLRLFPSARRAYALALERDRLDTRAIKGLLHLGEIHLHQSGEPAAAREIYAYLLDRSAESPLAEYMRQGIEEAERRLAQG